MIKVIAPGAAPVSVTEIVEGGREKVVMISLEGSASASGTDSVAQTTGGSIKVSSPADNVKLYVDGADKGALARSSSRTSRRAPTRCASKGGDRLREGSSSSVDLAAGETKDLGAVKLKVAQGPPHARARHGGRQRHASSSQQGDKKVKKEVPDTQWKSSACEARPRSRDTSEGWKLVATKKGYDDWSSRTSPSTTASPRRLSASS
jgi:hypothetical protein